MTIRQLINELKADAKRQTGKPPHTPEELLGRLIARHGEAEIDAVMERGLDEALRELTIRDLFDLLD